MGAVSQLTTEGALPLRHWDHQKVKVFFGLSSYIIDTRRDVVSDIYIYIYIIYSIYINMYMYII